MAITWNQHPEQGLRWLFLDLNSYFASVEQHLNPTWRNRPLIVVPVMTDSTCAIAASIEAKAYGIKTGTWVKEAKQRCPELIVVQAKHQNYVTLHHAIIKEVNRHWPVHQAYSIDEMACELTGSKTNPDQAVELARQMKRGIAERLGQTLRCSIGIAPNRFWAKIGSDLQKPDGLVVLPLTQLEASLKKLRLQDFPGIGRNRYAQLQRHGIQTPQDLWPLSAKDLRTLWGSVIGERFWYDLHGYNLAEPTEGERSSISHSHVMAPELREPSKAAGVARRLLVKAASRLRRLRFTASGLYLSARLENGPRFCGEQRFHPTQDSLALLKALETIWQPFQHNLTQQAYLSPRIKKIGIVLMGLTSEAVQQSSLFDISPQHSRSQGTSPQPNKALRLAQTLDQLNQRYGRDTVQIGGLPDLHKTDTGTKIAFDRIPEIAEFWE